MIIATAIDKTITERCYLKGKLWNKTEKNVNRRWKNKYKFLKDSYLIFLQFIGKVCQNFCYISKLFF